MSAEIQRGAALEEAQQGLSRGNVLTRRKAQIGDHPIAGGANFGVAKVEACLVERCERLPHLRVLEAGGSETGLGTLKIGLGFCQIRSGLGRIGLGSNSLRFGQSVLGDQAGDNAVEFAARRKICTLLINLRSGRFNVGDRNVCSLQRNRQVRFGGSDRNFVRLRIDPEQQLTPADAGIILDTNFADVAGDLGRNLRHERLNPRLRRVGREPVGEDVIDEQDQKDRKRDEDDLAHRTCRRWRGSHIDFRRDRLACR